MSDINLLKNNFREIFGRAPRLFRAPGRVNLIGEHVDYNEGYVLPFALARETCVAGAARDDTTINVHALDVGESFSFDLDGEAVRQRGSWVDYVEGAARCVKESFALARGADLLISSTVPIGAGLSSSAALEVSVGFALLALNEIDIDLQKLAFAAQRAEHEFVGIRSGIMDQFASVFCRENKALLLDCRSLETRQIPLEIPDAVIAVCDTKVKHKLAASEYNQRRLECETGVELLRRELPEIKSLRDVRLEDLESFQNLLPENVFKRCRHVLTENARTLSAAENLEKNDAEKVGQAMFLSHESLRVDYEVSCAELDKLVEIAGEIEGVCGARMTGGGFGGCTVNLLKRDVFEEFQSRIIQNYAEAFGFEPAVYLFRAAGGASEMEK
jgi:galactokinase